MMLQRRVDGLVLTSTASSAVGLQALDPRVPAVLLGRVPGGAELDSVSVDNRQGGYLVTRHLLALGHRPVAIVTGPRALSDGRGRFEGYVQALGEAALELDEALVREGDFSEASGFEAARALLERRRRPAAIFVCNNQMLMGALRAAREAGLAVPGDVALAGFDEVEWADLATPPLTMAEQPTAAMGAAAVDLLLERLEQPAAGPRRLVIKPTLRVRGSCGATSAAVQAESPSAVIGTRGGDGVS